MLRKWYRIGLFIHSLNKYLVKICYVPCTVPGSGDVSVKGWTEFLSSWRSQSLGKRSIQHPLSRRVAVPGPSPLFADFHSSSGKQVDFLQAPPSVFPATVCWALLILTGFPGGYWLLGHLDTFRFQNSNVAPGGQLVCGLDLHSLVMILGF